ncbi:MAG TPA: ABC transporter ATP-binding protein/permease [Allosphingosinicella sp.]|nr:ABC transporter ATP-binding protein/permease [Allosphingosinicella sp.]
MIPETSLSPRPREGGRVRVPLAGRLLSLLWPPGETGLKLRVAGAVLLLLAAKLINVGAPLLYKEIVDSLSTRSAAVVPVALIVAYALAHIGAQAVGALRQLVFIGVAQRAIRLTALQLFDHLHALSLRFHLDRQTGGLSHVVHRGTTGIEYLLELILFNVVPTLLELALVAAILWSFYSAGFAAAVVATILLYGAFTIAVTRWQVRHRREMNERDVAASVTAVDSLLNYETVKYFGAEAHEAARYEAAKRAYEKAAVRSESTEALIALGQAAIVAAGLVTVMVMAGRGVAGGSMTIGDFVLVTAYLLQLYVPLGMLGTVYGNVKQSITDVEAMTGLLAEPAEVEDRPGAPALAVGRGRILFDNVSFAYDPRRPILEGVSFEVPPGRTVALVGPSGGGKSSIARLLFRFYDVDGGAIRIDGQDLREVTQRSLRQAIGVVPQDTVLFNDSIHYNIAYGRQGATRAEVEEAARLARLHDFILRMPDGYDSRVGERGLKLSGGEKQRVAIARVILKRPAILIFDEATSALDSRTEREIQASLRALSERRTTLVIAHRLSTVVEADEILVVEGGRIVERGRHDALLAEDGAYAAMWRRQRRRSPREAG